MLIFYVLQLLTFTDCILSFNNDHVNILIYKYYWVVILKFRNFSKVQS